MLLITKTTINNYLNECSCHPILKLEIKWTFYKSSFFQFHLLVFSKTVSNRWLKYTTFFPYGTIIDQVWFVFFLKDDDQPNKHPRKCVALLQPL